MFLLLEDRALCTRQLVGILSTTFATGAGITGARAMMFLTEEEKDLTLSAHGDAMSRRDVEAPVTSLPVGTNIQSGTITLVSGATPLSFTVPNGTYASSAGATVKDLPSGTTVSSTAAGSLTFASGTSPIRLSLAAGTYTITVDVADQDGATAQASTAGIRSSNNRRSSSARSAGKRSVWS